MTYFLGNGLTFIDHVINQKTKTHSDMTLFERR